MRFDDVAHRLALMPVKGEETEKNPRLENRVAPGLAEVPLKIPLPLLKGMGRGNFKAPRRPPGGHEHLVRK